MLLTKQYLRRGDQLADLAGDRPGRLRRGRERHSRHVGAAQGTYGYVRRAAAETTGLAGVLEVPAEPSADPAALSADLYPGGSPVPRERPRSASPVTEFAIGRRA